MISLPATIGNHSSSSDGEGTDDPRLRLPALAQEDDVVAGQQRVLELRQNGVLVPDHSLDERLTRGDLRDGVASDLFFDGDRLPARVAQLTEGGRT